MATVAHVYEDRKMSMGRVFERAFAAIRANPLVIIGLALAVGAVPSFLATFLFVQSGYGVPSSGFTSGAISPLRYFGIIAASASIGIVINSVVQGALTRAAVLASEGKSASFGESLSAGFRVDLPLIGLALVEGICVMLGMVLLIVPGVILALMWSVAVPALVVEDGGIGAALSRSAELTKGARWKILGLYIVSAVALALLGMLLRFVGLNQYTLATASGLGVATLLGSAITNTINYTVFGTLWASLYVELRQWKEGGSSEQLAEVFG